MMPKTSPPIIIVGGHTMGLAVVRALSNLDIERILVSYDRNDIARVSHYVTQLFDSPNPQTHPEEFVGFLIQLAKVFSGSLLLPASDASLSAISKYKHSLSNYFTVACPEWDIVEKIIYKNLTYLAAKNAGIPVPRTIFPQSEEEVKDCACLMDYPCLVKPHQSHSYFDHFHYKMVYVNNYDEMITAYKQAAAFGLDVMLQEYIPGDDNKGVNYNSYFQEGQPLVEFTASKVRNAPPKLGSPCVAFSKEIPEVYDAGRKLLQDIGFYGYSCVEFKQDQRDGVYKLMEINGRHNLSGMLAVKCGINFPMIHYKHLILGELPIHEKYQQNLYWIDLTRDFTYHFPRVIRFKYSMKDYFKPYFSRHVFAILDYHDLNPFIKRCTNLARDAITRKRSL
jgi:D-aspartate ligase